MRKKTKKPGPQPVTPYSKETEELIKDTYLQLSEKDRRIYAAVEALKLPRGGKSYISRLLGCSRNTIRRGINERGYALGSYYRYILYLL